MLMISDGALESVRLAWWKAKVSRDGEKHWLGGGFTSSSWALAAKKARLLRD